MKCEFDDCENEAEFIDPMENVCCEECMYRSVEENEFGYTYEDYEQIEN